jgi:hypothetical protein
MGVPSSGYLPNATGKVAVMVDKQKPNNSHLHIQQQ